MTVNLDTIILFAQLPDEVKSIQLTSQFPRMIMTPTLLGVPVRVRMH